jgi:hypothetical protein
MYTTRVYIQSVYIQNKLLNKKKISTGHHDFNDDYSLFTKYTITQSISLSYSKIIETLSNYTAIIIIIININILYLNF